jgi:two-component system LytT family sensor kinase
VFASQLFWAGYVRPWPRAFAQESVYWFSWGVLGAGVFWMCRLLYRRDRGLYALGLCLGALVTAVLEPLLSDSIRFVLTWLTGSLMTSLWESPLPGKSLQARIIGAAGVNVPVYVGFVLGWHVATYYRQLRDREVQSMELESMLHQAQLQSLRNQLNPHFLFNTLHSIAELVHENPQLAEQIILRLGELLRQVLRSSKLPEVPLAEELDFVRGYVEIEQLRLGERLQVKWDVEPAALQAMVPSLILQPLVENAIQHGIAPVAASGALAIRASCAAGLLHLQVRDSGPGLSRQSPGRGSGIGLANTRARLERLYGGRHRFELIGDEGFVVNVSIPLTT